MTFKKITIVVTLVCFIQCKANQDEYESRPKMYVEKGHLYITVPQEKKIKFVASQMTIANVDIMETLIKADNATKLLETYQNSFSTYVTQIYDLESRMQTYESESRGGVNIAGNGTALQNSDFERAITRINRRMNGFQKGLNRLNRLLIYNECSSNPCRNGGKCMDLFNGFFCSCISGWEGITCENDVNECARFAGTDLGCQNGATCLNKLGTYECICQTGWFGIHCTRKAVDCNRSGKELCDHGTCVPQNNDAGYKCLCDQGWKTDGTNLACSTDVDECKLNHPPCSVSPSVPCINVPGSFYCGSCPQGYTGNGYYCADIDECAIFNGGCSVSPMVQCINTPGSKICGPCPPGYFGNGITCSFIGICNVNNGGCHPLAHCMANPRISTTFVTCLCPLDMSGNGIGPTGCFLRSTSSDLCNPNPCQNGSCVVNNSTKEYVCQCKKKYTGRNCDVYLDVCATNPCLNGGTCINFSGILYRCRCMSGFSGQKCQSEQLACGGTLTGSNGTLSYPPKDFYEHSINGFGCIWNIQTNPEFVIYVTFKKFQVGDSETCRNSWLELHDGRNTASKLIGRYCGTKIPLGGSFETTQNVLYLWFKGGESNQNKLELEWTSRKPSCGGLITNSLHGRIESPGSPGNYPNNRDCRWNLRAPFGKRFLFHFYQLSIGNSSDCSHDYLKFYNNIMFLNSVDEFARYCNSTLLPSPLYSPNSQVAIRFHSDGENTYAGFQITYSVVEGIPGCGGVYTSSKGIIQSFERGSLQFPASLLTANCEYEIILRQKTKIKVTFLEINLQGCNQNYIKIFENSNSSASFIGTYCGIALPGPYVSSSNHITLVSSTLNKHSKWKIQYETICSFTYKNPSGSFRNVGHLESSGCTYEIIQPLGYVISLTLKMLFFGSSNSNNTNCQNEYIEVRDGNSEKSALLGKYCSSETISIESNHNNLWIKVRQSHFSSFEANYDTFDNGCGGILTSKTGTINFPGEYLEEYLSEKKCRWMIMAPPSNVIRLTWMTFNLEQSLECSYDNVQVYDNITDGAGSLMGRYCGYSTPPTLLSSSNIVTILFESDNSENGKGFLLAYTFVNESNICGGDYFTSTGVIKSPGYPDAYPLNRECKWTITVSPGTQILLNITNFDLESYGNCRYDWLEIRNGGTSASPLIGRYCGKKIPKLIPAHANKVYLFFKSDISKSAPGFRISWSSGSTGCGGTLSSPTGSIISPHYPEPYNRNADCLWKIVVNVGSRVEAIFSDIDLEQHTFCGLDYVEFFDGSTTNSKSLGRYCSAVNGPIRSTSNKMLVRFKSDISFQGRGFQMQYSTLCHNTVKGFRGVIESPNFPNGYPQDINCQWDIIVSRGNKINITFSHFNLERSFRANSSCVADFVEIQYVPNNAQEINDSHILGRYCEDQNPGLITLDSTHAKVRFISDSLLIGTGFRLEWQLYGCGGILNTMTGTIESPNYPKSYPANIQCNWLIQVGYGNSIEITFHQINVETGYECSYDYVQVFNGIDETYNLLGKFCHQDKPITVTSSGNNMFVVFTADGSYQSLGFSANYSTVPTICGGKLTGPEGNIYSPNYPKNYNRNDTCEWLIDIDENHLINLEFKDVNLVTSSDCLQNYVKIFDGPSLTYPLLTTVCGTNKTNTTIRSSSNQVYVEFRAHSYFTSKGFHLKYKKACGKRIKAQGSGIINLSRNYEENSVYFNCSWIIEAANPGDHVSLTISHMNSVVTYCEMYKYTNESKPLQIYNGEFSDSPLLGEYCGTKLPPTLFSDGSVIRVQINSQMDFSATYTVLDSQCGGSLTSVDGYFASPGYPHRYQFDQQCEWTISAAPGNHLTLNVINFDIPLSENCNTDFLEIRQNNGSGKLLGVFCGQDKPSNLTNLGNLWLLFKSSNLSTSAKGFYAEYVLSTYNVLKGSFGQIGSPLYPRKFYSDTSYRWSITVRPGYAILITFKEFLLGMHTYMDIDECFYDSFKIYEGSDTNAEPLATFCENILPSSVKSKTNIITLVQDISVTHKGSKFLLEWNEVSREVTNLISVKECGINETININSLRIVNLTSPGYPTGYEPNLKCEWIFSTLPMYHLVFDVKNVDIKPGYFKRIMKHCFSDSLELFKKEDGKDWESVKTLCNDEDAMIYNLTSLAKVVFTSRSSTRGSGFMAKVYAGCGGYLTEPSGYIIFSNNTPRSHECEWSITVRSGRKIKLTFEKVGVFNSENTSCHNYLMIRNGKFSDSPILGVGKYCGHEKIEPLNTTSNHLFIKYSGDPEIEGFRLKYQEISTECGEDIILDSIDNFIEISSPNYPNISQPFSECIWRIRAPPGEALQIDFKEHFDLSKSIDCNDEYVEIRDGGTEYSPLLQRLCMEIPNTQFTNDNVMLVKYFTNIQVPHNGFKARISVAKCGGTLIGETGQINSKNFANFGKELNCTWYFIGPDHHYLNLTFVKFELGSTNDCNSSSNYVKLTDINNALENGTNEIGIFCGNQQNSGIRSVTNKLAINLVIKSSGFKSFQLNFSARQEKCGGKIRQESGIVTTPSYENGDDSKENFCMWIIEVPEGRRVTLQFEDPDKDKPTIQNQHIAIYDGVQFESLIETVKRSSLFQDNKSVVIKSSSNVISIYFWNSKYYLSKALKIKFSSNEPSECVGDFGQNSGLLSQPINSPKKYFCQWKHVLPENKTFLLSFNIKSKMNISDSFCKVSGSGLSVKNHNNDALASFCRTTIKPIVVRSPFPITILKAATTYLELNFTASFNTYSCGGIVGNEMGYISSPNFPSKPNDNFECVWLIKLPKEQQIKITIVNFNLGTDCEKAYLSIYNGGLPTYPKIGKFCQNEPPKSFISESNELWIEYRYQNRSGGISFNFTYEPIIQGCGGLFHDVTRVIQTPGYRSNYPANSECLWEIRSLPGYSIRLKFVDRFHLEESKNCVNDYLEIWDWNGDSWVNNGKRCGRSQPDEIHSTSDRLKLLFRSNDKISASGFRAIWNWQCGGTFESSTKPKYITSPGYPNSYGRNLNCTYHINVKRGSILLINFEDFDIGYGSPGCKYENLTIGSDVFVPIVSRYSFLVRRDSAKQFCGDKMPPPLRLRDSQKIVFRTDDTTYNDRKGFKFQYSVESCGEDITTPSVIESQWNPNRYDRRTMSYINCMWNITAPQDKIVVLVIESLQLQILPHCYVEYLSVYNDSTPKFSAKLATFCGNINEPTFIPSTSNNMLIKIHADPFSYKGFKGFVYFTYECGGKIRQESGIVTTPSYENGDDSKENFCMWIIEVPEGRRVTLQFEDPDKDKPTIQNQHIAIYDGVQFESLIETVKRSSLFQDNKSVVIKSSSNVISIYFWNSKYYLSKALKIKFSSNEPSECVGDFGQNSGLLSQPINSPKKYFCQWKHVLPENKTFLLSFNIKSKMNISDSFCKVSGSGLSVKNHNNDALASFCRTTIKPIVVRSPFPITILKAATTYLELNFTASFNTYSCGGIVGNEMGYISSPNFPSKPNDNFECVWLIKLPKEQQIKITIVNFNLGTDCEKAYLSIYNGGLPTYPKIGKFCQNEPPKSFISESNELWIEYRYQNRSGGISFNFTYEPIIQGCGGLFHDVTRVIQTPGYRSNYPANSECLWEIRSLPGYSIRLKFVDRFHLEESKNCVNDYLEIWDWNGDSWVNNGKRCGRSQPDEIHSTSDRLKLLFRSNDKISASGFRAIWNWQCGGTFESSTKPKYITSPGYPNSYGRNLNCTYHINVKRGSILLINFEDFDIGYGSPGCKYENLTIGSDVFVPIVSRYSFLVRRDSAKQFCGDKMPPPLRLRDSQKIVFRTDDTTYNDRKGFKFQYSVESCGEDITTPSVIESQWNPNRYDRRTMSYINCMWNITAPQDKIVVLVIESLQLQILPHCYVEYLSVYNDSTPKFSAKLATFCGNINEPTFIPSTSNNMLIKIHADPFSYKGFKGFVYFTYGPSKGCGGFINLTDTKTIESPDNLDDLDCSWKITAPRDYQVKIEFTSINIPTQCDKKIKNYTTDECKCAFIEVRDGGGPVSEQIIKICNNKPGETVTTSLNIAYIRMWVPGRYNNIFKATLTPIQSLCGISQLTANNTKQILTSPKYPNSYPDQIRCIWKITANPYYYVDIKFEDFDLANETSRDNVCQQDELEIIEDRNLHFITEGLSPFSVYNGHSKHLVTYNRHSFCGKDDVPFEYYSKSYSVVLAFKSINKALNKGRGFKLEYSTTACNRNYTSIQGRVLQKGYEQPVDCYINLTVPQNYTISIFFLSFSAFSVNCSSSGIEIKEGNSTGTLLSKDCGTRLPDPVFSNTNSLWIHFYSNRKLSLSQYDFIYTSSNKGKGCGGQFYNYQGRFTSPLYPDSYRKQSTCKWEIRVPPELKTALKFTNFDIKGNCSQNNVVVETNTGQLTNSHIFCANDIPATLFSDSLVKVTYKSSNENVGTGWTVLFQAVTDADSDIIWFM